MAAAGGSWKGGSFTPAGGGEGRSMKLTDALLRIGSEWEKGGKHRIYFNGLSSYLGVETSRYGSGHISGATLGGERISNSEAKRIIGRVINASVYYDFADNSFHGRNINNDDFRAITAGIRAEANALRAGG